MTNQLMRTTISRSAEGYPLIGYCVYWSIAGDLVTRYSAFLKHLEECGIPTEVARAPQAKSALIRAMHEQNKGKKTAFHRKVVDDKDIAAFAMVQSNVDRTNLDVDFQTETKISFDKDTKQIRVTGTNADEIAARYEENKDVYNSDNFRAVTLRFIEKYCDSISIRERGGVYFIPAHRLDNFAALQKLFALFPSCSVDVIPVIDTAQAKKSMWKSLIGEVTAEIQAMKDDVVNIDKDSSERSVEIRLARYRALKDKVENYETLLSGTATELKSEVENLSKTLLAKLA